MGNEVLDAALAYRELGWSLLPISSGTKKPACRSWKQFQDRPASLQQLERWYGSKSNHGLAVVLGPVSGDLFCRDFDRQEAYQRWAAENPALARSLPTVATSRGRHVYCHSQFGRIETRDDGELRGAGYCLLPPSIHPDGIAYRWIIPPGGTIPTIDVRAAGFVSTDATESTENTERTENTEEHRRELKPFERDGTALGLFANLDQAIERIIADTIPLEFGSRNRAVFQLARGLKSLPALNEADPNELLSHVRRWHSAALPYISTEPFEETWIDFLRAWPRVKFPLGADPMTEILARAVEQSNSGWKYELPGLRLLASLCQELQRSAGDSPFYLSCRKAGELLNVDHTTAFRWLWLLENDKVIQTVEKGSRGRRRASRFRFVPAMS